MSTSWQLNSFTHKVNLQAYFDRIGYAGPVGVNSETLKQLQWQHFLAIPYEILDIHLLGKVNLAPDVVERKIVIEGRGGFCYEQNTLFMHVLRTLGFEVTPVSARTRWQKPEDQMTPLTHLVLLVKLQGQAWLCDVGFSVCTSPIPLLIDTEEEQQTPFEKHRIIKQDGHYVHQMYTQDAWCNCFIFTLDRSSPIDWEMGSHFMSSHPSSALTQNYMFSLPTTNCRCRLLNKELTMRYLDGTVETRMIETEQEYTRVVREIFKINLLDTVRLCPPKMTWWVA